MVVLPLMNVPGDNIGTDVISPGEGSSDDKIDGSTGSPFSLLLSGKAILYKKNGINTKTRRRD